MEQNLKIGNHLVKYTYDIITKYAPSSILVVSANKSYLENNESITLFKEILKKYKHVRYYGFKNNLNIDDVKKGLSIFKNNNCDMIIAIGGGSVIDMAKCINAFQLDEISELIEKIKNNSIINKDVPLLAIPTTTGTGSESTQFSVIYLDKKKYSLSSKYLLPNDVIIDPILSQSQNPYQLSCSCMDAFCQAIESYWAVSSDKVSKQYALKAIELCKENIVDAVKNKSHSAVYNMAIAANYSGRAINISRTTAPHSVSYALTSYLDFPHGQAVAMTISNFFKFNYEVSEESVNDIRGVKYVKSTIEDLIIALGFKEINEVVIYFESLLLDIGLFNNEIKERIRSQIDIIVENGFNPDRMNNNPRLVSKDELRTIFNNICQ